MATNVLQEVHSERLRQDRKWGGPKHDDHHDLRDWAMLIDNRINPHVRGLIITRKELIEVAALAIAAVESIDRHCTASIQVLDGEG